MPISFERRGRYWWARGTLRAPGRKSRSVYESTGLETRDFARQADVEAAWEARRKELLAELVLGPRAVVPFDRAADAYLSYEPRSEATRFYVDRLRAHFGATVLAEIVGNQASVDKAVTAIVGDEAAPATKRRGVIGPLTSVLMFAHERQWCDRPNFDKPKVPKAETNWVAPRDGLKIEDAAAPHLKALIRFLLCTGARLSEALDLEWGDVDLSAATVRLHQKGDRIRIARLPPAAVSTLANLPPTNRETGAREGKVFRRDDGAPYNSRGRLSGGQIDSAWGTACFKAGVPGEWREYEVNQTDKKRLKRTGEIRVKVYTVRKRVFCPALTPHDLRHSWATWFYALTKDLLLLKDEGGWDTTRMVERYAHLMPSELVGDVALVWGASHPRIGLLPATKSVHAPPLEVAKA